MAFPCMLNNGGTQPLGAPIEEKVFVYRLAIRAEYIQTAALSSLYQCHRIMKGNLYRASVTSSLDHSSISVPRH